MTSSTQSASVLLSRVLSLKESSPLILITDTIAQSSHNLVKEFIRNKPELQFVYVSYETINAPKWAKDAKFIEAYNLSLKSLVGQLNELGPEKTVILIDSINYIPSEELSYFLTSVIKPNITVLTTYHSSLPEPQTSSYYPSSLKILQFIASNIFEILPSIEENDESSLESLKFTKGLNKESFKVQFTNRRKSGRSNTYKFQISPGSYTQIIQKDEPQQDEAETLKGLTTFNLTTSSKQKLAKDSVELPYLDAQNFESGGAIVYEFEKDDDYDEEDPYEDPF